MILNGLVVKASVSQAEDPGFDSRGGVVTSWTKVTFHPTVPLHPGVEWVVVVSLCGNSI